MKIRIIQIFLPFLFILFFYQIQGQSRKVAAGLAKYKFFQVPGKVKMDKGNPEGTTVSLINLDSKQTEKTITITSTGKFDLELSYFKEYKIAVFKDGYYEKELQISTVIPSNVWEKDSVFPPFSIIVSLYKKIEGAGKLSFEGKTIGKIYYSPNGKLDNFDSEIFVDDQIIQDEINNASKIIIEKNFSQKVTEALEYEKKPDLPNAYRVYGEALKIKPGDKFVIEKLKELAADMKDIENEAKNKGEFERLIALGDADVSTQKYREAILEYKNALKVSINNPIGVSKLEEAEKLLAMSLDKAKQDAGFNRLLAEGDANVKQLKFAEGINNFKSALVIRPKDAAAETKLAEAEKLLAQAIDKAKQDAEFNRLLAEGDANVKQLKFAEGINNFKSALIIRPKDAVAETKLADAEKLMAQALDKEKQDAEFNRLLAEGDANVKQLKFAEGIKNFKSALVIRPKDAAAETKLADAEKLMAQALDKEKQDAEFNRLLAEGDANVKQLKFAEGINNFKSALVIRPKDAAAETKLANAEKLLAQVLDKAKQDAEFNRLLAEGDANVKQLKFAEGINNFKSALVIRPKDAVAETKLAEAEKLLAQSIDKAKKDAEFNRLLAEGDANVKQLKFAEGINNFKSALVIRPKDAAAETKLAEAEKLLAQSIDKAKQDAGFNRLLAEGDANVKQLKFTEGIDNFKAALVIRPKDAAAETKLAEAEKLLAQSIDKAKQDAGFNRLLAEGDANVKQLKFTEGIDNFKAALVIRPKDAAAETKLANAEKLLAQALDNAKQDAEFNRLLAEGDANVKQLKFAEGINNYKSALVIRPKDAAAETKLANAEKLLAQALDNAKQDAEFNRLLAEGDSNVKQLKFAEGINNFKAALVIRPKNISAETKLANAEKMLAQALDKAKADAEFNRLLAEGDANVKETKYVKGIANFKAALAIRPGDVVILARIKDAENLIELALEKEKIKLYQDAIDRGASYFAAQQYTKAILDYRKAQEIRPSESLPPEKIAEIQAIIDAIAAKAKAAAEENLLVSKDKLYLEKTKLGDENYNKAQWTIARFYYIEGLKIKPGDKYSTGKIESCDKMIESEITADKIQEYNNKIASADIEMKAKNFSSAKFYYRSALDLLKWEEYPLQQLNLIDKILTDQLSQSDQRIFSENLKKADEAFNRKEYPTARFYYEKGKELGQTDHIISRLKEIQSIESGFESKKNDSAYENYIKKGDEAALQNNNAVARFYYQKANILKPDENYPKEKIKKIDSGGINP